MQYSHQALRQFHEYMETDAKRFNGVVDEINRRRWSGKQGDHLTLEYKGYRALIEAGDRDEDFTVLGVWKV